VNDEARESLRATLARKRIVVVCGAGGVGKTTTAAALALQAAAAGRRVLVCTIDPSRRLATSLGLDRLSEAPRKLALGRLGTPIEGELWAMTLDTKRAFDDLVERYASSPEARDRILKNRFYKQVSAALAGSHEYMAMEKLLELSASERFELVVLDTPPTRHALDFLEAPDRLMGFLDTSVLRFFLKPYFVAGRLTLRVVTETGALAMKLADRFLGMQFLQDLSEFFLAFEGMYDGFKERAARVHELLRGRQTAFVLVASPAPAALDEALFFHRRLHESEMQFAALVVNRVHPDPAAEAPAPRGAAPELDEELEERLVEIFHDQRRLARAEAAAVARLAEETGTATIPVPELEADVHDLRGLKEVGDLMLGSGTVRRRGRRAARERAGA
jgi:anion-transporting  ArsA/GET3 family ATPase